MSSSELDGATPLPLEYRLNQRALKKLVLATKSNSRELALLLAICDDRNLQARLIEDYEAELTAAGIMPLRVRLDPKQPSLRGALAALVAQQPGLQDGAAAAVTVLNANELLAVRLSEEKSEQEKFFFSLQWTREALLQFQFPIVMWLPDSVATKLSLRAIDFWSWRTGVYEFVAAARSLPDETSFSEGMSSMVSSVGWNESDQGDNTQQSVADLTAQITALETAATEQATARPPLLITLYTSLGDAYYQAYQNQLALEAYEKGLKLARMYDNKGAEAIQLGRKGYTLIRCGRPSQVINCFEQALALYQERGEIFQVAVTLLDLAWASNLLDRYQQVKGYAQQALVIAQELGERPLEANALRWLSWTYHVLDEAHLALEVAQQALKIALEVGDRFEEAAILNILGLTYSNLQQYLPAVNVFERVSKLNHERGDRWNEALALHHLAQAYVNLKQYDQAIDLHQQALTIRRGIGDCRGEAASLSDLGMAHEKFGQYDKAIASYREAIPIMRETNSQRHEAITLYNLGDVLAQLGQKQGAQTAYQQARSLFAAMGLEKWVERCDQAIRDLN